MNGRFRVPGLFHHLVGHAHTYRAIVFSPYLFWTTVVGASIAPERSVIIPCLHDEHYAYQAIFQPLLGGVGPGVVHVGARARAGPPDRRGDRCTTS